MTQVDIEGNLRTYLGDRNPSSRYASFDYCFNYFQEYRERGQLPALADPANLQESCLQLGFYLASWGCSGLVRTAPAEREVVCARGRGDSRRARGDMDHRRGGYSEDAITAILEFARTLRRTLHDGASDILVTKIMLGTMGCIPAFDTNFKKGSGVATFGRKSLRRIGEFTGTTLRSSRRTGRRRLTLTPGYLRSADTPRRRSST